MVANDKENMLDRIEFYINGSLESVCETNTAYFIVRLIADKYGLNPTMEIYVNGQLAEIGGK